MLALTWHDTTHQDNKFYNYTYKNDSDTDMVESIVSIYIGHK